MTEAMTILNTLTENPSSRKGPTLFLNVTNSKETFRIEARDVAKASPPCLRGPIKMRQNMRFAKTETPAILTGVKVSFKE